MIAIREARRQDLEACGRICHDAFAAIANAHNFPPDLPSVEVATGLVGAMIGRPGFYGVVAETDGEIIGSNFMDVRGAIFGIGPITVDPHAQNSGAGRRLMQAVLDHAAEKNPAGVRLVQAGYHTRSLSLYTKLGFDVREHLSCLYGPAIGEGVPGAVVRAATDADVEACSRLYRRVHGHDRAADLQAAIAQGSAKVVERAGRITGYTPQIVFSGHAVAETNDDLKALIGAAESFQRPGFLAPTRNGELIRWCLDRGLRITQPMTLMSIGLYAEPRGAWLPSILY